MSTLNNEEKVLPASEKVKKVTEFLEKNNLKYIETNNIDVIYDLYFNGVEGEVIESNDMVYFGRYFQLNNNYEKMEKYYLRGVEAKNTIAMNNLGKYHENITKNYKEMKKYYFMATNFGDIHAFINLGRYYQYTTKNYVKMEKYYSTAIESLNSTAMNNLGYYHHFITKDYVKMKKYYKNAIDLGDQPAMNNLGVYYQYTTKNYVKMEKYYLMAINLNFSYAMINLGNYYEDITKNYETAEKYYIMALKSKNSNVINILSSLYTKTKNYIGVIKLYHSLQQIDKMVEQIDLNFIKEDNEMTEELLKIISELDLTDVKCSSTLKTLNKVLRKKIDDIDLVFKYAPGGDGFNEAKKDFLNQVATVNKN